jgi:UPF0755 protein
MHVREVKPETVNDEIKMAFLYSSKKLLITALLVLLLGFIFFRYAVKPTGDDVAAKTVDIPSGSGLFEITEILKDAGLVHNRPFFWTLVIGKGAARNIKAGEYEFSARLSPSEIINKLVRGERKYYNVLIPEDINAREIMQRLIFYKLVNEDDFLKLLTDQSFILSLGIRAVSLEGYLYPSTYRLDRSMTTREIMRMMVNKFRKEITPEIKLQAEKKGMTINQLLTLASIIGKESGTNSEKPLISAVFHNRMKNGMKLQSDPTAIYGLKDEVKTILSKHLKLDNPYNTYRIKGLPPGPIANPGIDSIKAALNPENVNYLYFVSRNDGTHHFSKNLADHITATTTYRNNSH